MAHGLHVVSGNRLELLGGELAAAVSRPLSDPLREEIIVVQSRGMARWVQWELARRNGVCARTRFPFPKAFLRQIRDAVVPEASGEAGFDPDTLTWRVWAALSARPADPAFAEASRYAGDDPRRRFQLSVRLAGLLDQYAVYRPEMIADWESGGGGDSPLESWQAALWRAVRDRHAEWSEARWLTEAVARLETGSPSGLPERVALFGISGLPPLYLRVLATLARHAEVTLYSLQPSPEYWADLVSASEEQRALRRAGRGEDPAEGLHLERGPRLLMSLGRLGRGFLRQLADEGAGGGGDPFADPGNDTLLHTVQSDLFHLRDRSTTESGEAQIRLRPEDASLRVHVCHSPRRELEVLQDQLLDALDSDPSLEPRDILVLMPDIEAYAPLIHAVLGAPEDERCRLPYSIADRVPRAESSLADAFLRILSLPDRRFGRSEVEPLLEVPSLRRRFGVTPETASGLREWLEEMGTRWGLDAAHRGALGMPSLPQGTWRHGADRLLLGAAMAERDEAPVCGVGPMHGVEGEGAHAAGGLAAFVSALQGLESLRTRELGLSEWAAELGRQFDHFFLPESGEEFDARLVRGALSRLNTVARASGFQAGVGLEAVREQVEQWMAEERNAGGFLRGGVTFAALKPLRSIPARIIAVLGLNDTAFPRQSITPGFDLITRKPRAGDEARNDDDRHLFLETLLSARDRLHLSYVGQSVRDNAPLPPSAVVGELLDHLADISEGGAEAVRESVVVRHPLHAFSPDYFGARPDARLFTYSAENRRAAVASRAAAPETPRPFLASRLDAPDSARTTVELDDLIRFLKAPAKFFLEERLGIRLPRPVEPAEDRECFSVDRRDLFSLKQRWLEQLRESGSTDAVSARALADGDLPLGPAGEVASREIAAQVRVLLEAIPPGQRREPPSVSIEVPVGGVLLRGQVRGLAAGELLTVKPAREKAGDLLDLWVRLLAVSASGLSGGACQARLLSQGSDGVVGTTELSAPANSGAVLGDLVELLAEGMRHPLPLFPRCAAAFTKPVGSRVTSTPLERALGEWHGGEGGPGDSADPAVDLCFGRVMPHPLDGTFADLAKRVFEPLWAHAGKGAR